MRTSASGRRARRVDNDELVEADGGHGAVYTVAKASLGLIRDFRAGGHLRIGLGALYAVNVVPVALRPDYGQGTPAGTMAFIRLKID